MQGGVELAVWQALAVIFFLEFHWEGFGAWGCGMSSRVKCWACWQHISVRWGVVVCLVGLNARHTAMTSRGGD